MLFVDVRSGLQGLAQLEGLPAFFLALLPARARPLSASSLTYVTGNLRAATPTGSATVCGSLTVSAAVVSD